MYIRLNNKGAIDPLVIILAVLILAVGGYFAYTFTNSEDHSQLENTNEESVILNFNKPADFQMGESFEINIDGESYYSYTGVVSGYDGSILDPTEDYVIKIDLNVLSQALERFYDKNGYYPSEDNLKSDDWIRENLKGLEDKTLYDTNGVRLGNTSCNYVYSTLEDGCVECELYELSAQTSKGLYSKAGLN